MVRLRGSVWRLSVSEGPYAKFHVQGPMCKGPYADGSRTPQYTGPNPNGTYFKT